MDKIKMALGLDGAADAGEVLLAVENLCAEHAYAQFRLARAQEEVLAAREATADVFVEALVELGFMDAEALEAARAVFVANPDVAAVALLGSADIVAAANPYGCNQYGHRKGHNGGSNDDLDREVDDFEKRYNSTPKNERWKLDKERKELEERWKNRDNPTLQAKPKKPAVKRPVAHADDLDSEIDDFEKRYNSTPKNERWKLDSKRKELEEKWRKRRDEDASAADEYNKISDELRDVEGKLVEADDRFYDTMDDIDAHEEAAKEREKLQKEYERMKQAQSRIREDYNIGIENGKAYSGRKRG